MQPRRWATVVLLLLLLLAAAAAPAAAQRTITVTPPSRPSATTGTYGESWAVVIGINDYRHPRIDKLRYAVNDATSVQRALVKLGWKPERIIRLLDGDATKASIEQTLGDRLRREVKSNDRLFVFFAGHGVTDTRASGEEEGYLLAVDSDPGSLYGTGISMGSLRNIADRVNARHILFVMDACFSGYSVTRGVRSAMFEDMMRRQAVQVLTAGTKDQVVSERDGHGVFTQVLLRALADGAAFAPGKPWLALDELGVWVRDKVYAETGGRQEPRFGNMYGDGQFVFFRPAPPAKVASVVPAEPKPPTFREEIIKAAGSLAITSNVDFVEVFLNDRRIGEVSPGKRLVAADLEAGSYRLRGRAQSPGYHGWSQRITVAPNQQTQIVIDIAAVQPDVPKADVSWRPVPELRAVYFDFDSDRIKDDFVPNVDAVVRWLADHPRRHLLIQGYDDARRGERAALDFGERRARAVYDLLVQRGASASRLKISSHGHAHPLCVEQNEACWSQNRRVQFQAREVVGLVVPTDPPPPQTQRRAGSLPVPVATALPADIKPTAPLRVEPLSCATAGLAGIAMTSCGLVHLDAGKLYQARQELERAVATASGDQLIEARYWLAETHYRVGQYARADALFRQVAQESHVLAVSALFGSGWTALRAGDASRAWDAFGRVIATDVPAPIDAWSRHGLALSLYALGRFEEAESGWRHLRMRAAPNQLRRDVDFWYGEVLGQVGRSDEARKEMQRFVDGGSHPLLELARARETLWKSTR